MWLNFGPDSRMFLQAFWRASVVFLEAWPTLKEGDSLSVVVEAFPSHDDFGADADAAVEVGDIMVVHSNAAL